MGRRKRTKDIGPQIHHFVPKFHLTPWVEDGHILELEKSSKSVVRKGLRKTASEYKYYELIEGSSDEDLRRLGKSVELWASAEENSAAPIIKRLRGNVGVAIETLETPGAMEKVIRYTAFQLFRSPGMRLTVGDIRSWRAREIWNDYLQANGYDKMPWPASKEDLEFFDKNFSKIQHFGVMLQVGRMQSVFLERFHASLLVDGSQSSKILISDFAVFGTDDGDFLLPLSPNCIFRLSQEPEMVGIAELSDQEIGLFNSLQIQQGRYFYCLPHQVEAVIAQMESNPEWCGSEEEVLLESERKYQASSHWWELPGVSKDRIIPL